MSTKHIPISSIVGTNANAMSAGGDSVGGSAAGGGSAASYADAARRSAEAAKRSADTAQDAAASTAGSVAAAEMYANETAVDAANAAQSAQEAANSAANVRFGYATRAELPTLTAGDNGRVVNVTNDQTAANNGAWRWTGSAWVQGDDRTSILQRAVAGKPDGEFSPNIANKAATDVQLGARINTSNGTVSSIAGFNTTGFIAVDQPEYSVTNAYGAGWYSASKQFITGVNDVGTRSPMPRPSNAAFIRVSTSVTAWEFLQLQSGPVLTNYQKFSEKPFVSPEAYADRSIPRAALAFIGPGKNLYNPADPDRVLGGYINPTGGAVVTSPQYNATGFIPVVPGATYSCTNSRFVAFYNIARGNVPGINAGTVQFVVPAGVYFTRLSYVVGSESIFQIEQGPTLTAYEPYYERIAPSSGAPFRAMPPPGFEVARPWAGKTFAALGDSITAGATWQTYVGASTGVSIANFGLGGSRISGAAGDTTAMCQDARINAIPENADVVFLMGGTNDWAQNVALGSPDSNDPTTFNGALNTFAAKAYARWPTKRLLVAATPYGEIVSWNDRPGWTSPARNSLGLTTNDYAEAVRLACRRLNIGCVDVAQFGGWGATNIQAALGGSTTDHLHPAPNSLAAMGIASTVASSLNFIAPAAS